MSNLLANQELQLSGFAEYLLKQQLVKEGQARFCVMWVRKFLARPLKIPLGSLEERIAGFVEELQMAGECQDWQLAQAERALRLYFVNFTKNQEWARPVPSSIQPDSAGTVAATATMDATRSVLRLKHYSYSTEKTYLDWVRRYFEYLVTACAGHKVSPGPGRLGLAVCLSVQQTLQRPAQR